MVFPGAIAIRPPTRATHTYRGQKSLYYKFRSLHELLFSSGRGLVTFNHRLVYPIRYTSHLTGPINPVRWDEVSSGQILEDILTVKRPPLILLHSRNIILENIMKRICEFGGKISRGGMGGFYIIGLQRLLRVHQAISSTYFWILNTFWQGQG